MPPIPPVPPELSAALLTVAEFFEATEFGVNDEPLADQAADLAEGCRRMLMRLAAESKE